MKTIFLSLRTAAIVLLLSVGSLAANAVTRTIGGSSANYTTLKQAFDSINLRKITGDIVLVITGNTTETASAELKASGTVTSGKTSSYTSVKIYPDAAGRVISSNMTSATINLNGADHVTFDGSIGGTGTDKSLTIENLYMSDGNVNAYGTIFITNDATYNTIKNCVIKGSYARTTLTGIISFGNTATALGNSYNTITNNDITSSATGRCQYAIYSKGHGTYPSKENVISNNNFYNTINLHRGSVTVNIENYNQDWTVSGNSFYETESAPTTNGSNSTISFIKAGGTSSSGITITGNYIGGTAPMCGGTALVKDSISGAGYSLIAISVPSTNTGGAVTNNTIQNITWLNGVNAGGDLTHNLIDIVTADITVSNNTLGAVDKPITVYGLKSKQTDFRGIYVTTSSGNVTVSNNTIAGLKTDFVTSSGNTTRAAVVGIANNGTCNISITGNTIHDLNAAGVTSNTGQFSEGIKVSKSGTATVLGNTIYELSNARATNSRIVYGINMVDGTVHAVSRNFVHSLNASTSTAEVAGLFINSNANGTYDNNIISLSPAAGVGAYGIYEEAGTTGKTHNIYHNTLYIGGSTTGSATAALFSKSITGNKDIRNNIFINVRTNTSGSTLHFGVNLNTTGGTYTLDYNDYYVSGSDHHVGRYGNSNKTTLVEFQTATGQEANGTDADPGISSPGTTPESFKGTASLSGVAIASVTTDFAGSERATTPLMGAYESSIWDGNAWIGTPAAGTSAVINGDYNGAGFSCNDLVVNANKKLNLTSGTLQIGGDLTLKSDANGTATFIDNGGTLSVTGTTKVEQYLTYGRNWYASAPVSAAPYDSLSLGKGGTDGIVAYDEVNGVWQNVTSGSLAVGKGYIQVASAAEGSTGTVTFTGGTLNSGNVSVTLSRTAGKGNGYNLVGNPYPSYLDWTEAATANTNVLPTMWFRTKTTTNTYTFATVNATNPASPIIVSNSANTTITKYIPPMQAYWVRLVESPSTTTYTVTNAMRDHADNASNTIKAPRADQRQMLRLQLANGTVTDEAVVYFDAAASNNFDRYDSPKMMNNSNTTPDIYSKVDNERLVINGLNSVSDNMELPLGFTLKAAATGLKLKVSELSNFESGTRIYLLDKEQNTKTELSAQNEYSFDIAESNVKNESRFALLFRAPGAATGIDNAEKAIVNVYVNAANQINIAAPVNSKYAVYNALGQLIENGVLHTGLQTVKSKLQNGIFVVRVNNQSTRVIIK